MSIVSRAAWLVPLVAACQLNPPGGTQIGALREPDPAPEPPVDFRSLDMTRAVEDALRIGGLTTLSTAWAGHLGALDASRDGCPAVWIGPLPEDVVDVDMDGDAGMSWLADCTTDPGRTTYAGFTHWTNGVVQNESGRRDLVSDAVVASDDGTILFDFDGRAEDSLDLTTGTYTSVLDGELGGSLVGVGRGLRTGGDFEASWSADGSQRLFGTVTSFDGFGPADTRDPVAPELANLPAWSAGMPRFTSVRFDLSFSPDCALEPIGFIGIRGNEGFWFDVYFLPDPELEPGTAAYKAFPFEEIDNVACDGIGTLFARNVNLAAYDDEDPSWSREITPDFAAVVAGMPLPTLDTYVYTLRDIVEE
jgi:hypothetical protein